MVAALQTENQVVKEEKKETPTQSYEEFKAEKDEEEKMRLLESIRSKYVLGIFFLGFY